MVVFSSVLIILTQVVAACFGFYNPIVPQGQDPSVKYYEGNYYLVQSVNDARIDVRKASKLENLGSPDDTVTVFVGSGSVCCEIWAPELFHDEDTGLWYIYFAADDGNNPNHRSYVIQSAGSDPLGPYTFVGKMAVATDMWAIDSTVMKLNNQLYYIWSGSPYEVESTQNLYIASMSSPTNISSDRYVISEPSNTWEWATDGSQGVNEGPAVLQANGNTWIVYSASGSWEDSYCLGLLSYLGGDPLQIHSWYKHDGCVFSEDPSKSVYGTGHNCFTTSPDQTEIWNVYHADEASGGQWGGRSIRAQTISFDSDGSPNFGTPVGFDEWVDPPSGELEVN